MPIRVTEDLHPAIAAMKREDVIFDDLLSRFVAERRELVEAGAGIERVTDAVDWVRGGRRKETRDCVLPRKLIRRREYGRWSLHAL